ncbi:MAG: Ppx/GppA family phosphatase [Planctomycetes bacterium]|nr:Ppx/GppA family phosphatase [Planctomycetota bacterium]
MSDPEGGNVGAVAPSAHPEFTGSDSPNRDAPLGAAVDLGSNSFHMIVARLFPGEVRVIDRQRERVRLAGGLGPDRRLDEASQERALECLQRFGGPLRSLESDRVRVVGTNTFRKAVGVQAFIQRCEAAVGHPVHVISGTEEARLVYLGVVHASSSRHARRLVIDIGGGSTELILGEGHELLEAESISIGCVSYSMRFFPKGEITREAFKAAVTAARVELQPFVHSFRPGLWDVCLGSSGTAHALERILGETGWSDGLTWKGLRRIRKAMIAAGSIDALRLPTLKADRRPVLPGGLAILLAIFESLEVDRMTAAAGGLREGLLYDLHGRFQHDDVRDRTIRSIMRRFQVDEAQALRVERTATVLYDAVRPVIGVGDEFPRRLLTWGARLHEVGLAIAHVGYHKHGEYFVRNARLDGFSRGDQENLAILVRLHRKKLLPELLAAVSHLDPEHGWWLVVLLRLAVVLHRSRDPEALPAFSIDAAPRRLILTLDSRWVEDYPVTLADLRAEAETLASQGFELVVRGDDAAS